MVYKMGNKMGDATRNVVLRQELQEGLLFDASQAEFKLVPSGRRCGTSRNFHFPMMHLFF